jgi:hypothetical protein
VTWQQTAAAIFGEPFTTDPCAQGTHDCRFRACACPGHAGLRPGDRCALAEPEHRHDGGCTMASCGPNTAEPPPVLRLAAGDPCPGGCQAGPPGDRAPERLRANADGELSCPTCWERFGVIR